MTPLAALEPMLEVLPPTGTGKARSLKVYRGLKAEGYACDTVFVVEEQGRRGCESYGVEEFPANGGRGFYVRKPFAEEPYTVFIGRVVASCTCPGGCYGKRACRHEEAIRAAIANGWL
jgi:hypothetical protein